MYNSDDKIMMLINQLKNNVSPLLYTNPAFVGVFISACKNSLGMTGKDTYRVDILENVRAEITKMGIQDIIDIYQAAYDRFDSIALAE